MLNKYKNRGENLNKFIENPDEKNKPKTYEEFCQNYYGLCADEVDDLISDYQNDYQLENTKG